MKTKTFDIKDRTYHYALTMVKLLSSLPNEYASQTIGRQLLRSATSVGANIVEARSASSRRDFANFYSYALKSANESKFWLTILQDSGKLPLESIVPILEETDELAKILASSILTLKRKQKF